MNTASEATGTSSRAGWLPFRVAIVVVVVGLLVVTYGSLIAYVLYRGEQSVELLKRAYLEQVAATTIREVSRLPATVAQVLRVQRYRLETGYYSTLEMGVGSDTGAAVVGNMGSPRRIKYGVVGNIVNVAARIETFTVGGQVLVSDATRQALGDRLVADGPLKVEGKGLGAAIRLWEVLALQGDPPLALPAQVRHLAVLHPPLEVHVRLFLGKRIDRQLHSARLHRLGAGGGEIESDAPLAVFDALQVLLTTTGGNAPEILDGKVIALSEHKGVRTTLVCFTGLDWDTKTRIEAFARRDRDTP